jgi:hypothetical protein
VGGGGAAPPTKKKTGRTKEARPDRIVAVTFDWLTFAPLCHAGYLPNF